MVVKLNILFMSEKFYPHGSGGELATYLHAKILSQIGLKVRVITNRFEGEPDVTKSGNITVHRIPLFRESESTKYSILKRVDVLLSSHIKKLFKWADVILVPRSWYSVIPLAKMVKKPVIVHLHGYLPICPLATYFDVSKGMICDKKGIFCQQKCIYTYEKMNNRNLTKIIESTLLNSVCGWAYKKILRLADAIICVSRAQKKILLRNRAILSSKIYIVHNPLPIKVKETSFRIQNGDFGYFGGPSCLKGFHVLCKAAALVKSIKPIRIHATQFSSDQTEFLKNIGIITYGKLDQIGYNALYEKIRAVIAPSIWVEPWGYVVSEALLNGRIVIASNIGGISEQTIGCKGVFLIEPGDYKALAENILYVEGLTKEKAIELGIKNRECIMKRFTDEKIAEELISVLEKVVR